MTDGPQEGEEIFPVGPLVAEFMAQQEQMMMQGLVEILQLGTALYGSGEKSFERVYELLRDIQAMFEIEVAAATVAAETEEDEDE